MMNTSEKSLESGEKWVSVSEAAAAAGVSARTVRRWLTGGELTGQSIALDGGGRAWLVLFDERFSERTQSERTRLATRLATRTDTARTVAKRPNLRLIERTDKGKDTGSDTERPSERPSERTWPDAAPEAEKAERREADFREEIRFLRSTVEQLQRDGAETRAALREALRAMPKQLTSGAAESAPETPTAPAKTPDVVALTKDTNKPEIAAGSPKTATYGDLADWLEAEFKL